MVWHLEALLKTRYKSGTKTVMGRELTPMSDPEPPPQKKTPSDRFCLTPASKRATKCWLPLPSTFPSSPPLFPVGSRGLVGGDLPWPLTAPGLSKDLNLRRDTTGRPGWWKGERMGWEPACIYIGLAIARGGEWREVRGWRAKVNPPPRHWIAGLVHNCSLTDEQTKEVEEEREEGVMTRLDPLPQASPSVGRKEAEGLGN